MGKDAIIGTDGPTAVTVIKKNPKLTLRQKLVQHCINNSELNF